MQSAGAGGGMQPQFPFYSGRTAIIWGCNYADSDMTAANDAARVAAAFESLWARDNCPFRIETYISSNAEPNMRPTRANFLRLLSKLAQVYVNNEYADEDSLLVLYFAGHGTSEKIHPKDPESTLWLHFDPETQGGSTKDEANSFPWYKVAEILVACPARHVAVLLDCCYAGAAFQLSGGQPSSIVADAELSLMKIRSGRKPRIVEKDKLFDSIDSRKYRCIVAACGADQVIYDKTILGGSVFSTVLVDLMNCCTDLPYGYLTIEYLSYYIYTKGYSWIRFGLLPSVHLVSREATVVLGRPTLSAGPQPLGGAGETRIPATTSTSSFPVSNTASRTEPAASRISQRDLANGLRNTLELGLEIQRASSKKSQQDLANRLRNILELGLEIHRASTKCVAVELNGPSRQSLIDDVRESIPWISNTLKAVGLPDVAREIEIIDPASNGAHSALEKFAQQIPWMLAVMEGNIFFVGRNLCYIGQQPDEFLDLVNPLVGEILCKYMAKSAVLLLQKNLHESVERVQFVVREFENCLPIVEAEQRQIIEHFASAFEYIDPILWRLLTN